MMPRHQFIITKVDLMRMYIDENRKRVDIAKYYGCSDVLIKKKLQAFDIKKPKELENLNKKRRIEKPCLLCTRDFEVVRSRSYGKWEIKFCSHKCSSDYRYLGADHKRKVHNSVAATRRAKMKSASVDLSSEEREQIKQMYLACPDGHEVDHIIPISMGGKHHPDNLQHLPMSENRRKHNKIL
jgi:hypothetical protein